MAPTDISLHVPGPSNGPREALLRRVATALERLAGTADEAAMMRALSARSDLGALAALLSSADPGDDPALALDPTAPALARAVAHRSEIVDRAGPMLGAGDVARLLGISRQAVDKRRKKAQLLAVKLQGDWHYPEFQFAATGIAPGFEVVLPAMAQDDPWVTLDALTAPDSALGGDSPAVALRAGRLDEVRRALGLDDPDGFA